MILAITSIDRSGLSRLGKDAGILSADLALHMFQVAVHARPAPSGFRAPGKPELPEALCEPIANGDVALAHISARVCETFRAGTPNDLCNAILVEGASAAVERSEKPSQRLFDPIRQLSTEAGIRVGNVASALCLPKEAA